MINHADDKTWSGWRWVPGRLPVSPSPQAPQVVEMGHKPFDRLTDLKSLAQKLRKFCYVGLIL